MGSLSISFDDLGADNERRQRGGAGGPPAYQKSGYLQKQNPRGLFSKGWKQRWFELDATTLSYYDSQTKRASLRTIHLSKVKSCGRVELKGRPAAFEVATNIFLSDGSPRIFSLQASSEEEANDWVRAISSNRMRFRSHSFSRSPSQEPAEESRGGGSKSGSEQQHASHSSHESLALDEAGPPGGGESEEREAANALWRCESNVSNYSDDSALDATVTSNRGRVRPHSLGVYGSGSLAGGPASGGAPCSPVSKGSGAVNLNRFLANLPGKSLSSGATVIKTMVSKQKRRFVEDGFNLDLAYITPRIIAMGFPSEGVEGSYRNHISEVYRFFETRHPDKYMIFNLCSERSYDPARFHDRVICFPFDDHNPPPFEMIRPLCRTVERFLAEAEDHVVAVHCKAGKGRTGVMITACLLHLGLCSSADEALAYYAQKRTYDGKGVTIRSQKRYCHYFAENLHTTRPLKYLCLSKIKLSDPPAGFGSVVVRVYNGQTQLTFLSRGGHRAGGGDGRGGDGWEQGGSLRAAHRGGWSEEQAGEGAPRRLSLSEDRERGENGAEDPLEVDCQNAVVSGDVHVVIGFRSRSQGGSWFYSGQKDADQLVSDFWFHTSFVHGHHLHLPGNQIDGAPRKDKRYEKFKQSFSISVSLAELPSEGGGADHRVHHPDSGLSGGVTASPQAPGALPKVKKDLMVSGSDAASDLAMSLGMRGSIAESAGGGRSEEDRPSAESAEAAGEACGQAIVLYDFKLSSSTDDDASKYLSLRTNDVVTILKRNRAGWWLGLFKGQIGWFPARYCVEIEGEAGETPMAV